MSKFNFLLEGTDNSWIGTIVMIALVILFFYFFMIRPQKKQEKKDNEMRDALEVGDEITTIGGIIGKVVSIKGETFVIESTKDKTKIRFLKGALRSVDVKASDKAAAMLEAKQAEEAAALAAQNDTSEAANADAASVDAASTDAASVEAASTDAASTDAADAANVENEAK